MMRLHIVNNYWRTTAKLNLFVKHNYITWHPVFNYITYKTYLKTKCPCKGLLKKKQNLSWQQQVVLLRIQ